MTNGYQGIAPEFRKDTGNKSLSERLRIIADLQQLPPRSFKAVRQRAKLREQTHAELALSTGHVDGIQSYTTREALEFARKSLEADAARRERKAALGYGIAIAVAIVSSAVAGAALWVFLNS